MRKGSWRLGRPFRRLWVGFALASTGDGFAYGAVPLLAIVVDPRALAVSAVVAADRLPWLLIALPAGSFADRFERGRVMVSANICRAVVFVLLGVLVITHTIDLWLLILAVLGNAAGRAVYFSALQAAVPDLVEVSSLDRANGALSGTEAASEHLAGPIVGAFTFALARAIPFFGDGAMLGLSVLPLRGLRSHDRPAPAPGGSIWDGVRRLFADRRLRLLLMLVAGLSGLQGLVSGVLVLVATRDWGVHVSTYGLFVAAGAAGNLPGALLANRVVARLGSIVSLLLAAGIAGLGYLLMALSHSWLPAGAAFALTGFAVGVGIVVSNTLRQRLAPPELMGRIGAAWRGIAWGAAPVGALVAGVIAVLGGVRLPLVVAGSAQIALAILLAVPLLRVLGRSAGRIDSLLPETRGADESSALN
ncbi:MAG: MFS transporter [Acidimicrobiales bacterium]